MVKFFLYGHSDQTTFNRKKLSRKKVQKLIAYYCSMALYNVEIYDFMLINRQLLAAINVSMTLFVCQDQS